MKAELKVEGSFFAIAICDKKRREGDGQREGRPGLPSADVVRCPLANAMNASTSRAIRRRSVSPIYRTAPPVIIRTRHPTGGQETSGAEVSLDTLVRQQEQQERDHSELLRTACSRESILTTGSAVESPSVRSRTSRRGMNGGMSVSLAFTEAGEGVEPINDSPELRLEEDRVRRRLAFHFLNPYEKYKERRMVPWKLLIQFFKVSFLES